MKWRGRRKSTNVEDRRGMRPAAKAGAGIGVGGAALLLLFVLLGGDPKQAVQLAQQTQVSVPSTEMQRTGPRPDWENELAEFVSVILADTETVWDGRFQAMGKRYQAPKLVLFTDAVQSACGMNSAAVGPFYCPADHKAYIDLSFYRDLDRRFGAPGDFAQAYVLAHEVGHHVQTLLGISTKVHAQRRRMSKEDGNRLSVMQELQADCFAGVWAHHAHTQRQLLEAGDVEEGLRAAAAIGDDRLQKMSKGRVVPEAFTHGTSEQRMRWFSVGMKTGDPARCDTFGAASL